MTRRVLIAGACGFIGRHLATSLMARDIAVVLHHRPGAPPCHLQGAGNAGDDLAATLRDVDSVVWLASSTTPSSSASDPALELTANLGPLLRLLRALQDCPDRHLVFVSSGGTVYGDVDLPAGETLPAHPRSYYAAGKVAGEAFIEAYCLQHGGVATVLRPSNVYGPGQLQRRGFGVIPAALACLRDDRPLTIWGDGSSVRDYCYVDDFVASCRAALQAPPRGLRTLNVCSGQAVSLSTLLDRIEAQSGLVLRRDYRPARASDLQSVLLDPARIRRELGWSATTALDDGIARTWDWFRSTAP